MDLTRPFQRRVVGIYELTLLRHKNRPAKLVPINAARLCPSAGHPAIAVNRLTF